MANIAWFIPQLIEGSGGHRTMLQHAAYLHRQTAYSAQTKRNAQKHQHQRGNESTRRQARHRRRPQVRQQGRSRS